MNNLSWKNFKANFKSYLPALLILGLGTALINTVLKIQQQLDTQIHTNVAGIEALVGAKGSPVQLTLANIYHLDDPTGNISLEKAIALNNNPMVEKALPLAYGDNHKGFKLLGTNQDYIAHFKGKLSKGKYITEPLEVIIGYNVAKKISATVGYTFYSNHGTTSGHEHKENVYKVVGVLEKSNTVLDNLLITSLASFWKTHHQTNLDNVFDSLSFAKAKKLNSLSIKSNKDTHNAEIQDNIKKEKHNEHHHDADKHSEHIAHSDLEEHLEHSEHEEHPEHEQNLHDNKTNHSKEINTEPNQHDEHEETSEDVQQKEITALLLKFKGPAGFFLVNQINSDPQLMAINPSQTILKFLTVLGVGYSTIKSIAISVISVSVLTLVLALIQIFSNRKYELALLRTMGASNFKLAFSLLLEVVLISITGFLFGMAIVIATLEILPFFVEIAIFDGFDWTSLGMNELIIFGMCLFCGIISAMVPLYKVYRIDISKTLAHEA